MGNPLLSNPSYQFNTMRFRVYILLSLAVVTAQAQTLTDPEPSGLEHASLLELPPATVIDEWSKQDQAAEDKAPAKPSDKGGDKKENEGIQIQIEKTVGESGGVTGKGKVKIDSPWPAKPISVPPAGWRFVPGPSDSEPFRKQVKLDSGYIADLSITPYVLVPIEDGKNVIKIAEPGYKDYLKFSKNVTLGVMLQNSTAEIENHEKQAAEVIQRLQQLLSSLPR